ncbi:putative Nucleolysin TIAR [Daphnia magna]|uniref:Putative Nucleolysin TIAR n=1 Tax=Daphnia magna TaxID=35525 RepID=A0A162CP98_9CRUS|nr:putative Nucleolysin TIAR [Daphnia magna]
MKCRVKEKVMRLLRRLFLFANNCRDCRVVRDPQTLKSKGYGFVSFVKKSVSAQKIN